MKIKDSKIQLKESQIQKQVINYLSLLENTGRLFFFRAGSGFIKISNTKGKDRFFKTGKAGCPDIVCCYKGYFLGLEIKTQKGKQSNHQKNVQKRIEQNGGKYFIVRDINDVEYILENINRNDLIV